MLYYEVLRTEDPENQPENFEVVDLLRGIADKLLHAQKVNEGIDLLPLDDDALNEDMLVDERDSAEHTEAEHLELKKAVDRCLEKLTDRQRNILSLRYGLSDDYLPTLEEIGRRFKKARERIREIEAKASRR